MPTLLALLTASLADAEAPNSPNVVWMAPFLTGGGYSSEAISYAMALEKELPRGRLGAVQFAEQMDRAFVAGLPDTTLAALQAQMQRATPAFRAAGSIAVCHSTPDLWVPSIFAGWDSVAPCPPRGSRYAIGRTMYETDALPPTWAARCNALDEVWVPTAFHKKVFEASGVEGAKIIVVPEAVDTDIFDPAAHAPLALPGLPPRTAAPPPSASGGGGGGGSGGSGDGSDHGDDFVFLSVFKWERRKGWDVLLEAFLAEFRPWEAAVLVIKTRPFYSENADFAGLIRKFAADLRAKQRPQQQASGFGGAEKEAVDDDDVEEEKKVVEDAAAARIHVLDRELPQRELPRLYRAADAFVLPSRGEGWGRPHAEAMAMALPTIATNWSGPTAFMDASNAYPLEVDSLELVGAGGHPGHRWAQPSVRHLRRLMRHVFEDREGARAVGASARRDMVERFSPAPVARLVAARLREVEIRIAAQDAALALKAAGEGGEEEAAAIAKAHQEL